MRDTIDPIDQTTLGRVPLLTLADVEDAVAATGFNLLREVDVEKFAHSLNVIVEHTIRRQLTPRLTQEDVQELRCSIETYRDLSRSLSDCEFFPPVPPVEWMNGVKWWICKAKEELNGRSKGGAPPNVEQAFFLPQVLGLIHAGFGYIPTASISNKPHNQNAIAFRFVVAVRKKVEKQIAKRGFSASVKVGSTVQKLWNEIAPATQKKRLEAALSSEAYYEELWDIVHVNMAVGSCGVPFEKGQGPEWRVHSRYFDLDIRKVV